MYTNIHMYYLNRVTQGWGKLGLGLRPHQKKKKKSPRKRLHFSYKIIYIYIYIYFKGCAFFLLVMLRIIPILLLAYKLPCYLITKKWFKHSLFKLMKFIDESQYHIIFWTFYNAFSAFFIFISIKILKVWDQ